MKRCGWFGEGRGQCLLSEGHPSKDHTCEEDGRNYRVLMTGLAAVHERERRIADCQHNPFVSESTLVTATDGNGVRIQCSVCRVTTFWKDLPPSAGDNDAAR